MAKRRRKKGKKITIIIVLIILIVLGVVLYLNLNKKKPEKTSKKKKEVKVEEKLKILDLNSDSRPYAVMINNISTVWGYQCGLQDAYLVYEIIVEGGYTRLMAIFKDKELDRIGSVRSSRHYFLDYALENDAVYVHFGWSPQAESDMSNLGVNNINFMSYAGYTRDRSLGLASEHTAFTTTSNIKSGMDNYGYRKTSKEKPLLNYSVKEINLSNKEGSMVANSINIGYSTHKDTSFDYDPEQKVYKRSQNNTPQIDYVTKNQYTVKNIITYKVNNYTISGDNKGRQTLENIGSGDGYFITNGYMIPITWEKRSRNSKTIYKYMNGTELKVNDGNTHIEIQPLNEDLIVDGVVIQ